jgi:hypothetical protein
MRVFIYKLHLISPIVRRLRTCRNRLLQVSLLGRNPALIILRIFLLAVWHSTAALLRN